MDSIQGIHHLFSRALPAGAMEDWAPSLFNEILSIDMGNRYFTNRHDLSGEIVPFKSCVDPNKYLEWALGTDYVHTYENEVEYFEAYIGESGSQR